MAQYTWPDFSKDVVCLWDNAFFQKPSGSKSTMINWQSVIFNSFWIVGLAIMLAAFSYTYWLAQEQAAALNDLLKKRPFQPLFWLSCILIGIGLVGTSQPIWEIIVWSLFIIFSVLNMIHTLRDKVPSRH